ncbi:MAG: YdcF family protein [Clostridia bacterium]|nr:YdcF family protein [Clostridia bacterium]
MSIILAVVGIVFCIYGLCLCLLSNLNLGVIMTLLLGVFFLGYGIFYKKIKLITQKGIMKAIKIFIIALICAETVLVGFIAIYGQRDNVNYNEDAVIVLGAGIRGDKVTLPLKMRLDKTIEYHNENPEALIVVSGGQGFQETVTEASAMEKYLINNGVSGKVIIKEEKATSTNENMRFSKEILDTYFNEEYTTVVITNNFHIYRGVSIAKIEGIENVSHMHASLQWYNIVPCYLRESLAVLKMWILG